ncbi:MAG: hypothetical protein FJY82_15545 [Candidatus Aminicenantes bacterium]|nr:hypothetical protein [Candidatus Aminicenantes bacterium]
MKRMIFVWIVLAAAALASAGCRNRPQVQGVSLEVEFAEAALTDNLMTDMTFTWKTGSDFVTPGRDNNIYVHFWHNDNLLLQDDYIPDPPTSKWEPDRTYAFTRRIYIPQFIDEFDPAFKGKATLRLSVGFYNPFDRSGKSSQDVLSKKLTVVPPPLGTPEVIYESGWYDLEVNQDTVLKQWRWTAKEARCVIDNPRRDALLVIRGEANIGAVKNQKIVFKINDLALDEFVAEEPLFDKSYAVKKEMLGDKDEFLLTIGVDRSFVPAKAIPGSNDERELGIQVSFIYFR